MRSGCKERPNNKQLPGVGSSCLRDKLSRLYLHSKHTHPSSISASPDAAYRGRRHRRNASDVMDSVSSMLSFDYGLNKSRSIAFASRNGLSGGGRRKKDEFWSKLLKLTRKGTNDALMHSPTIKEQRG